MQLEKTKEVLRQYGKFVVQQSRSRLTKGRNRRTHNATGSLYQSLEYELQQDPDTLLVAFDMNDYGAYLDQGVSGTKKKYNTPFSYTNKKPPIKSLLSWIKTKRIRFRDKKGKFTKGSYRSIAFVMQNSIYKKGIKPTLFFTKPFEQAYVKYEKDILKAFLKDAQDSLGL